MTGRDSFSEAGLVGRHRLSYFAKDGIVSGGTAGTVP